MYDVSNVVSGCKRLRKENKLVRSTMLVREKHYTMYKKNEVYEKILPKTAQMLIYC